MKTKVLNKRGKTLKRRSRGLFKPINRLVKVASMCGMILINEALGLVHIHFLL